MEVRKSYSCCFIGHRKIKRTKALEDRLYGLIDILIKWRGVETFLFGSKSEFDALCLEIVTKLKEKYAYIKRVYVRAEYQYIDASYNEYLLQSYDETYFPSCAVNAGKSVYVKRNTHMIDEAGYCIFYYTDDSLSKGMRTYKSGTKLAFDYAKKKHKIVYNLSGF